MTEPENEQKRLITIEDLNRIRTAQVAKASPDGRYVAFVQASPADEKRYDRNIDLFDTQKKLSFALTHTGRDFMPRWSPDGQWLAFLSARSEKPQIHVMAADRPGEARQLTTHENGVVAYDWSPDSQRIAFISRANSDERAFEDDADNDASADRDPKSKSSDDMSSDSKTDDAHKKAKEEKYAAFFDPQIVDRIPYREGTAYLDDRTSQLYMLDFDAAWLSGARSDSESIRPERLTDASINHSSLAWSADGSAIYFSRPDDGEIDEANWHQKIYRLDLADGTQQRISPEGQSAFLPLPSPDGVWLAYVASQENSTDSQSVLILHRIGSEEHHRLTESVDREPDGYEWTHDSRLYLTLQQNSNIWLYRTNPDEVTLQPVMQQPGLQVRGFAVLPNEDIVFSGSTPHDPSALYHCASDGVATELIRLNPWLDKIQVQPTETISYTSDEGVTIQGWVILPPGYDEAESWPLAVNIHGGPHAMWSDSEPTMWHEWQVHAAKGYVVFYCNPRGSAGYGESFQMAAHNDWGDTAMRDVLAGVGQVVARYSIDTARMAVTGGSYGGYMTAWIIGHDHRFACAVAQRGVYNLLSFYGTSDVPLLISSEFDTEPWQNMQHLWQHSPLAYAQDITTPLLLIHAENDFRVPIEQAEQLFAYVRRSGGTVRLIRYPRDGHEMSRSGEPAHRVSRLTHMVDWFDRYCQPATIDSGGKAPVTDGEAPVTDGETTSTPANV